MKLSFLFFFYNLKLAVAPGPPKLLPRDLGRACQDWLSSDTLQLDLAIKLSLHLVFRTRAVFLEASSNSISSSK